MLRFKEFISEAKVSYKGDGTETKIGDQNVSTGTPIEFHYVRNKEKAGYFGSTYGQDIEPHGQYISPVHSEKEALNIVSRIPNYESGKLHFKNPLVLKTDDDAPTIGWKQRLSDAYKGKKGKSLSKAISKDGYDGIITSHPKYGVSETVNLKMFHKD